MVAKLPRSLSLTHQFILFFLTHISALCSPPPLTQHTHTHTHTQAHTLNPPHSFPTHTQMSIQSRATHNPLHHTKTRGCDQSHTASLCAHVFSPPSLCKAHRHTNLWAGCQRVVMTTHPQLLFVAITHTFTHTLMQTQFPQSFPFKYLCSMSLLCYRHLLFTVSLHVCLHMLACWCCSTAAGFQCDPVRTLRLDVGHTHKQTHAYRHTANRTFQNYCYETMLM